MDVFVYGTLTDRARVARVVSAFEFRGEATLRGLHRVDGEYPTLAPGGSVAGRVLRTPEIEGLDAYEGVDTGLYVRVAVPTVDAEDGDEDDGGAGRNEDDGAKSGDEDDGDVAVYVGDPDALGVAVSWPGTGTLRERVERFLRENEVGVEYHES